MSEYHGDTKIFNVDELSNSDTKVFHAEEMEDSNKMDQNPLDHDPKDKKKKRLIISVVLLIALALGSFFYYRHRNQQDIFDPFSLIEVNVEGADGYASLHLKEKEVLSEDEANILERIEFVYPKEENLSNEDKVVIEVDVLDEEWFTEAKIKLDPMKKTVVINELDDTESLLWQEAVEMQYSMRKGNVHVEGARLNLDEFPEKVRPILKEAFLDVQAKDKLQIGDEIKLSLKLSSRNKKDLGKIGYRIETEDHRVTVEEFVYVPRYMEDIPELDRLVKEKYQELESSLKKESAQNIALKGVCYNDAMDENDLKIYQREGYDADNGTLLLLIQYQLEGQDINLSKVAGYTNVKAKNKKLDKEPSEIEFFYEETDISRIMKYLMDDGFECEER